MAVRHSASVAGDIENLPTKPPPAHAECLPIVWKKENEEDFEFQVRTMEKPRAALSVVSAGGRRPAPIHACDEPDVTLLTQRASRRSPPCPSPLYFLDTSARF